MTVIGVICGAAVDAAVVACAAGFPWAVVHAGTTARIKASSATADAVDRSGRMSIYGPLSPAGQACSRGRHVAAAV
jgi:hypothetical protein